jgi:hypothetical protein
MKVSYAGLLVNSKLVLESDCAMLTPVQSGNIASRILRGKVVFDPDAGKASRGAPLDYQFRPFPDHANDVLLEGGERN